MDIKSNIRFEAGLVENTNENVVLMNASPLAKTLAPVTSIVWLMLTTSIFSFSCEPLSYMRPVSPNTLEHLKMHVIAHHS